MESIRIPESIRDLKIGYLTHSATGEGMTVALVTGEDESEIRSDLEELTNASFSQNATICSLGEIVSSEHSSALFAIQNCSPYLWRAVTGKLQMIGNTYIKSVLHVNHS